jgi:hypothetical protein
MVEHSPKTHIDSGSTKRISGAGYEASNLMTWSRRPPMWGVNEVHYLHAAKSSMASWASRLVLNILPFPTILL